jgi:hypothetical protein
VLCVHVRVSPRAQASALSVGGTSFGALYGAVDEEEARLVLHTLLKRGVNLIDTAPWYGQGKSEECAPPTPPSPLFPRHRPWGRPTKPTRDDDDDVAGGSCWWRLAAGGWAGC